MNTINKEFEGWEQITLHYPRTIIKNSDAKMSLFIYLSDTEDVPSSDVVGYEISYGGEHYHIDDGRYMFVRGNPKTKAVIL